MRNDTNEWSLSKSMCLSCWSEEEDSYNNEKKMRWNNKKNNFTFNYFKYVLWNNQKYFFFYSQRVSQKILSCQEMAVRLMKKNFFFSLWIDEKFSFSSLKINFWYKNVRWRVTMCFTRAKPHDNLSSYFSDV